MKNYKRYSLIESCQLLIYPPCTKVIFKNKTIFREKRKNPAALHEKREKKKQTTSTKKIKSGPL